jgi:3-hydroxybutyrate dehydrogenase
MLKGRTALITGSLDGIGYAIAQALARQGCAIMLNGFGDAALIQTRVDALRDLGVDADNHGADLSAPAQIEELVATTGTRFGAIYIGPHWLNPRRRCRSVCDACYCALSPSDLIIGS